MKTPHRLIHDAKEAGAITEQEWRAFMRARNEADKEWLNDPSFFASKTAWEALENAFKWSLSGGYGFWEQVQVKLSQYEKSELVGADNA